MQIISGYHDCVSNEIAIPTSYQISHVMNIWGCIGKSNYRTHNFDAAGLTFLLP